MSTTTSNLELFKYTESDYEDDFNLQIALNENWDKIDQLYDIISLENSGTLNLTNNRVHKVSNASDTITFILPSGTTTGFSQMIVELYMSSTRTINLGTSYYFNGTAPSMSSSGYYTIIYEYDSVRDGWVVGVLKKAA